MINSTRHHDRSASPALPRNTYLERSNTSAFSLSQDPAEPGNIPAASNNEELRCRAKLQRRMVKDIANEVASIRGQLVFSKENSALYPFHSNVIDLVGNPPSFEQLDAMAARLRSLHRALNTVNHEGLSTTPPRISKMSSARSGAVLTAGVVSRSGATVAAGVVGVVTAAVGSAVMPIKGVLKHVVKCTVAGWVGSDGLIGAPLSVVVNAGIGAASGVVDGTLAVPRMLVAKYGPLRKTFNGLDGFSSARRHAQQKKMSTLQIADLTNTEIHEAAYCLAGQTRRKIRFEMPAPFLTLEII